MLAVIRDDAEGEKKAIALLERGARVFLYDSDGQTAL